MRNALNFAVRAVLVCFAMSNSRVHAQSEKPIAPASPEPATPFKQDAILRSGELVTLRIRQVIPFDGLSPGDRILNGLPAIMPGDRILAELMAPRCNQPALVGGTIAAITPAGRFGKSGRVTLELGQLVTRGDGQSQMVPWIFDLEDRRFGIKMRRKVLLALFALEGAGVGASVGANLGNGNNPLFIGGGAGVGLLAGIGYASLMPGHRASLEPGDTFQVQVGALSYRAIPASPLVPLYPAADPEPKKGSHEP
jgi:hypothetical protein